MQDFLLKLRSYKGLVPKSERVWLRSASIMAKISASQAAKLKVKTKQGRRTPTMACGAIPNRCLLRRRLSQGAPYKGAVLRELLWDWFVDIRRSVASTISPKFMLLKARELADRIVAEQHRTKAFEPMPVIDYNFLHRFKRDKGIVFRRPNMRFKCSRAVLLRRLRAMWVNIIKVRRLAEIFVGRDLSDAIYGIDEKPIHFNEAGSKAVRTLEIQGAPSVRLKENHAASRERASLMTMVTSSRSEASSPATMPLEIMFRAQSAQRTRKLEAPADLKVSIQWAPKGSYRQSHIVAYLRKWLRPWTPERAKRSDYRILLLDVAGSHLGEEVVEVAWSFGYVVLYHYGCTTGVAQVNDTDLHGALEAAYLHMEQVSFNEQQLLEPGCVSRRPQDVIDDAAAAWRTLNHGQGVLGHFRNGLANKLDGTQDHMISREALTFWQELDMASVRREAVAYVDAQVAADKITSFSQWQDLVMHAEDPGINLDEGAEFEGDLLAGELLYYEDGEREALDADDAVAMAEASAGGQPPQLSLAVQPLPGDAPADVEEAVSAVKRLRLLQDLRAGARETQVPAAAFHIDREIAQLQRGLRSQPGKTGTTRKPNMVLRRALDAATAAEAAKLRAKRAENFAARRSQLRLETMKARAKAQAEEQKQKKAALQEELKKLPVTFDLAMVGDVGAAGHKARIDCLERLKLRSPELPLEDSVRWNHVRDGYSRFVKVVYKHGCGLHFLTRINKVLEELKSSYTGPTPFNRKGEPGDPTAFLRFFKSMSSKLPKPATSVSV